MHWDAELYKRLHSFSVKYGQHMLELVNRSQNQTILDLGCGTGELTHTLAEDGAMVTGLDASAEMIAKARENFSEIEFVVMNALDMPYDNKFDTVFSNAALHWIKDHKKLLQNIFKALKAGGRLITEFGAKGNIETIQKAFRSVITAHGLCFESQFFFPGAAEYTALLENAGFKVDYIEDFDRPTPLGAGADGLRKWIIQFYEDYLKNFSPIEKERIYKEMETACSPLWQTNEWVADYRRIRVVAAKPA